MAGKLFIMCTHAGDDVERATIAFVMATAAQASDVEVIMGLQAEGVRLAVKGTAATISAPNFPPLADLAAAYSEAGGKILVCGPCAMARGLDLKTGLVEDAVVVGAAAFVAEIMNSTNTAYY